MPLAAAGIVAAGTLGGALISSNAAAKASDAQVGMQNAALQFQQQQVGRAEPYNQFGTSAMNTISGIYGFGADGAPGTGIDWSKYTNTPDYQFASSEAQRGLGMQEASKHLLNSGGLLRDSLSLGAGYAGQQFGSTIQRLMSMVGIGQTAVGQEITGGNGVAQTYGNIGNAQAQGIMGQANPWVSALNSGPGNALGAYKYFGGNTNANPFASSSTPGNPLSLSASSYTPGTGTNDPTAIGSLF